MPGDKAHNSLFVNPGHGNHWLTLRLVGTRSNRAAIEPIQITLSEPEGQHSIHRVWGNTSFGTIR